MKPSILIVFDDLFPGGLRTLNERMWNLFRQNHPEYQYVVITGINYDQSLQSSTFPYADRVLSYPIPRMNQFCFFFYTSWHTIQTIRHFRAEHTTHVIVGNNSFSAFGALLGSWIYHVPFQYWYHGSLFAEVRSLHHHPTSYLAMIRAAVMQRFYWSIQWIITHASTPVCFSSYAARLLQRHFGVYKSTHLTVPFTYQFSSSTVKSAARKHLGIAPTQYVIVFPSRIEPRKGLHLLLRALAFLPKTMEVSVFVVGPLHGESVDYLLGVLHPHTLPLTIHVYFTGALSQHELTFFYQGADLTVVPSVELETLGMVTLESLSYGTPVVGLNSGATPTILRAIDRLLISNPATPKQLARTIHHGLELSVSGRLQRAIRVYMYTHHKVDTALNDLECLLAGK